MPADVPGLRVALVAPFGLRPKGTTSARLLPIGRVLAAQGAAVGAFIPPWDDPSRSGRAWREAGVDVAHSTVGTGPQATLGILLSLGRLVQRFRPDVIHVFKPIGYSGVLAWVFGRRARGARHRGYAPLVVVDTDDLEGPGGWATRRRLHVAGWLRGLQERLTLARAPWVTVASRWLYHYARTLGVADGRALYLPNGHDVTISHVSAGENGPRRSAPSLLWYTRFTEADPARTAELLAPLLREHGVRLAILGEEIAPGAQRELEASLERAGVAGHVEWLGYRPEVLQDYVRAHADSVVSIYPLDDDPVNRARSPSKLPQLMALGVPIVAEAVGDVSAYLRGFEGECLTRSGDNERFRERVGALLANPAARRSLGDRLLSAADRWRWDSTAGELLAWYHAARASQGTQPD